MVPEGLFGRGCSSISRKASILSPRGLTFDRSPERLPLCQRHNAFPGPAGGRIRRGRSGGGSAGGPADERRAGRTFGLEGGDPTTRRQRGDWLRPGPGRQWPGRLGRIPWGIDVRGLAAGCQGVEARPGGSGIRGADDDAICPPQVGGEEDFAGQQQSIVPSGAAALGKVVGSLSQAKRVSREPVPEPAEPVKEAERGE